MQLRGVIFDLDGTIGDTLPVCYAAFREVFQTYLGHSYTDKEIRAMFGPTEEGMIEEKIPERYQEAFAAYLAAYEKNHDCCVEPFEGMHQVLEALDRYGIRRAIVTGKGAHSAEISLRRLGLAGMFERVEAGSAGGNVKPANMRRVVEGWGLDPSMIASLGDAPSDIRSARENGILPLAAAWAGTADYDALQALGPAHTFRKVDEFLGWIDEQANRGQ